MAHSLVEPHHLESLIRGGQQIEALSLLRNLEVNRYTNPNTLNQLGIAAQSLNLHELARRLFERALGRTGPHIVLLNNLALSLMHLGELATAEQKLQLALQIDPNYEHALINHGTILLGLLRPDEARQAFERALHINPSRIDAVVGVALTAQSLGHPAEAIRWSKQAIEKAPQSLEAYQVLAESLRADGQYQEAYQSLEESIRLFPRASGLYFELGQLHHKIGRYDDAMWAFNVAHTNLPKCQNDKETFLRDRAQLEELYEQLASSGPRATPPIDPNLPIFVVGSPRSGTTLLDRMLSAHPDVTSLGETHVIGRSAQDALERWPEYPSFSALVEALWTNDQSELLKYCRNRFKTRLKQLHRKLSFPRMIDKMPSNAWRLGFVSALAPGAPILHLVRDGRDVALSTYAQNFTYPPWHAHSLEDSLLEWSSTLCLVQKSLAACAFPYYQVCYERLVTEPETVLREVLRFLGISFDDSCLNFHRQQGPVQTASRFQVREPLHDRSVGRARHYPEIYAQLTELARDDLEFWGYPTDLADLRGEDSPEPAPIHLNSVFQSPPTVRT